MLTACSKLADNLGQAVRTELVDGLLADLLQDVCRPIKILMCTRKIHTTNFIVFFVNFISEAEKLASVSKIQFQQKIMERESLKKISEIEGKVTK